MLCVECLNRGVVRIVVRLKVTSSWVTMWRYLSYASSMRISLAGLVVLRREKDADAKNNDRWSEECWKVAECCSSESKAAVSRNFI
jgi:hypothetical protein